MPKLLSPLGIALLYAAFAALWIVASDEFLSLVTTDITFRGYLDQAKGLIFVAVTSGLLYLLLKGWHWTLVEGADAREPVSRPLENHRLLFIILVSVVPLLGFAISTLYGVKIEREAYVNLEAIVELKADQFENWLDERQGDSLVLMNSDDFTQQVDEFVQQQTVASRTAIEKRLNVLRTIYRYDSLLLLNAKGQLLLSSGEHAELSVDLQRLIQQSLSSRKVQRGDFYQDEAGHVYLDWVVPIVFAGTKDPSTSTVVVLRATAQHFLFPLIQTWPTSSPSAESLLVRQDADSVLFINSLRHRNDTIMTLRLPLTLSTLPAVVAVRANQPGVIRGFDYRNVDVLAAYHPIKNTPWHLIAKIDRDEVLAPMRELVLWVSLVAFVAIVAISVALMLLWRQQQRMQNLVLQIQQKKAQYQLSLADQSLQESQLRNQSLVDSALDGVISMDKEGRIIAWNPQASVIFGYSLEQALGCEVAELIVPPNYREAHRQGIARFIKTGIPTIISSRIEVSGMRVDGSEFPMELSIAAIEQESGYFFSAYIRDISERKHMEEKLSDSHAFNISVLDSLTSHIAVLDAQGVIVAVNNAWRQFGKENALSESSHSLLGVNYLDICKNAVNHPYGDEANAVQLGIAAVLEGAQTAFHLEYPCHSVNQQRWFSMKVSPLQVPQGGVVVSHENITERKKAEMLLKENEEKLRLFFSYSSSASAMFDRDMRYIAFSQRWLIDYGLLEQDLVGRSHYEVFPDMPERWKDIHQRCLAGAIEKSDYDMFIRSDGAVDWLRWESHPWLTSAGDIGGIIIFSEVITERKRIEDALVASETEFRLLAEAMPQIVWITDADGLTTYLNQQWVDYTGLTLEESYGHGWNKPLHPDDQQHAWSAWQNAVNNNATYSLECQLRRADGTFRWWLVRGVPLNDQSGNVYKWFGTCTDIHELKESENVLREKQRLLADSQAIAHVGSWIADINTNTVTWSDETFLLYGLPVTDQPLIFEQVFDLLHPDDIALMQDWVNACLSGEEPVGIEFRTRLINGSSRWLFGDGLLETDPSGNPLRMVGTVQDITERKNSELKLQKFKAIIECSEDAIISKTLDGIIESWNPGAEKLFGYTTQEAIGNSIQMLIPLDRLEEESTLQAQLLQGSDSNPFAMFETTRRCKDGHLIDILATISSIKDNKGNVVGISKIARDITAIKKSEETIHNLAFYDPLTKLPNRRLLIERLQQAMNSSTRHLNHGAVLFIDLDNFKVLNDVRGPDMGDLLLIDVAKRLQLCTRTDDTVACLGGDDFVVVLEELSTDVVQAATQAESIAEKIRVAISQPFYLQELEYYNTSSIGISLFRGHEINVDDLLKHTDAAMYQAKQSGRNLVRFFDPDTHAAMKARIALEADLRLALPNNQLQLYYQMQVDNTGKIVGAEALIRWQHPERGLVSPMLFIPVAEGNGLIIPIGLWVLETACAQIKRWELDSATQHLQLAVNVSALQFRQFDFVEQIVEVLKKTAIHPGQLKLELTESLVLEDVDDTIAKIQALKQMGVHFSMDDFGTGYSSLSYLSRLPLDQLKIDQSFVYNIGIKPSDAVIVQTIIGMAKNLDMEVIAEGVETEQQRDFLEQNGCCHYQGYLFGKPVPLEDFERLLRERELN